MTEELNEVPRTTPDFATEAATELAELFPEVVADGKINLDTLKTVLDIDVEDGRERFGLTWPGKREAIRAAQTPTTATLMPDKENSVDWDTTQNVFIEGDNLEALKILQKHYYGQIKMIYIDPPYNTGNDFVYADDYADSIGNYLELTGQTDEGGKLSTNSESAGRFHSNWLNMMYPRLKLARNLLREDGILMISIDDTEYPALLMAAREIFGEINVIGTLIHQRAKGGGQAKYIVKGHDYIVVVARDIRAVSPLVRRKVIQQKTVTKDGIEYIKDDDIVRRSFGKYDRSLNRRCFYEELEEIKGSKKKKEIDDMLADGSLFLEWQEDQQMHVIYRLIPVSEATSKVYSIIRALSEKGKADLSTLGMEEYFSYPKSVELLTDLLEASVMFDNRALVLDFFAGSGTTAHAVMQLNAKDGGSRRCISIQLPEPTGEKSEARKAGYETISQISRERIRRAGKKILKEVSGKVDGNKDLDVGFRAYKLVDTNFTKWKADSGLSEDELVGLFSGLADSANDHARPEALLTEVLLKLGFSLSEKIEIVEVAGLSVFSVADGLVMAYLDEHTQPTLDQLRALVAKEPERLVILEDAFNGDDELKTNLVQECKTHSVDLRTA